MKGENESYGKIKYVFIAGIVVMLALNFYMRERIRETDAFHEIQFTDSGSLAEKLKFNESRSVSFRLANYEVEPVTFAYEIDSRTGGRVEHVTLLPGESAVVDFEVKPVNEFWSLNFTVIKAGEGVIDVEAGGAITQASNVTLLLEGDSMVKSLPISHNLSGLGVVYHTNLSLEELARKPFTKRTLESVEELNSSSRTESVATIYSDGTQVFVTLNETENTISRLKEPFIVKFYEPGAPQESMQTIHFWYEVK